MKLFMDGKDARMCVFAISIEPATMKRIRALNNDMEKKYKLKFGDAFIMRTAIEEFLNNSGYEGRLANKKFATLIRRNV